MNVILRYLLLVDNKIIPKKDYMVMRVSMSQESRFGCILFLRCWALIKHSATGPAAYCGIQTTSRNRFLSPEIDSSNSLLVSVGIKLGHLDSQSEMETADPARGLNIFC